LRAISFPFSMTDQFRPRDIYEMGEFFEDLLFMRTNKFSDEEAGANSKVVALSATGSQLLGRLGITGRIFRRWYQTTWGWDNPSQWFAGETPRMELCKRYPDLTNGDVYASTQLLQSAPDEIKVMPVLYEKKEIKNAKGIITMGFNFLPKTLEARSRFHQLSAPSFDPGFKEFANNIEAIEREVAKEKLEKLPIAFEARCWRVFWSDACITIPLNCGLKLSHNDLITIGSAMQLIVERAVKEQASIPASYINFDSLFSAIWEVFCSFDSALLPLELLRIGRGKSMSVLTSKAKGPYSLNVYYNLGNLFDELLLFPADRYFGACECVWTDKENFLNDLVTSFLLLNNDLQLPTVNNKLTKAQKLFRHATAIEERSLDIYRIWFCPPTCFRILPKFVKYFW